VSVAASLSRASVAMGRLGVRAVALVACLHGVLSSYVITTPRKWTVGSKAQVCLTVEDPPPAYSLSVSITAGHHSRPSFSPWGRPPPPPREENIKTVIPETAITPIEAGSKQKCVSLLLPETTEDEHRINFKGVIGNTTIDEHRPIRIQTTSERVFIQTDKYIYKDAQKVQFRILTIKGPFFKVITEPYAEVYVENPSGSRIAQWLNVTNAGGLVHLDLQLIDEADQGVYKIKVRRTPNSDVQEQTFKVEDYVLPRFELKVTPPSYFLADREILELKVCAKYTFGQPVRGNLSVTVRNNGWGRHRAETTFSEKISGCEKIQVPTKELEINNEDYFVYNLGINVDFEEDGTGNKAKESAEVSVTRTALTIKEEDEDNESSTKPELPHVKEVKVSFPDGSPAVGEPMSVCVGEVCRNLTTDAAGKLLYTVPPHLNSPKHHPEVKSVNYQDKKKPGSRRNFMYWSTQGIYSKHVFSPTNSSLLISPDSSSFNCPEGRRIIVEVPVMFAAANMSETTVYIQAISRGQIQYWNSQKVQLKESPLPIDESTLVEPMQPPKLPSVFRGQFTVTLELPPTVSPQVKVLIWYSRDNGEVVSDYTVLKISECLNNKVGLSWPKSRVEQGTTLDLTLSAEPKSLCSLGIVDKSVELLNTQESLTVKKVFESAEESQVATFDLSQINDREYCSKIMPDKKEPVERTPDFMPPGPPGPPGLIPLEIPEPPLALARKRRSSPPIYPGGHRYYTTEFKDALAMFDEAGLHVLSDLVIETRPCSSYYQDMMMPRVYYSAFADNSGKTLLAMPDSYRQTWSQPPSSATRARTYFPETWLWSLLYLDSGSLVQQLTLPDTITEWVGKAVCVHPTAGLGLSPVTSIVTFTPFFVDLTVLPSIKKGEVMPIIISVFNYQEHSMPVRVILEGSAEYEILGSEGLEAVADQSAAGVRSVCVPSNDKGTVTVRVRPLAVGDVNVTVQAEVDTEYPEVCGPEVIVNKVDRIIKPINVEFEGFPKEKTWNKYMCSADLNENLDVFEEWQMEAPAGIVEDSARSWITAVGDLMGPTLENLGHLIRMPYGCGEQNMLNFAPNIYILQYLEASKQNTNATEAKLKKFMRSGYQRELKYKHRVGSYSAFGESDESGSTWLTAFVLKSFAQARQYIDIDGDEINMSRDWLKSLQMENGCFESVGKIFHKGMKGGLATGSDPKILTAYIMAALIEAGENTGSEAIANSVYCLQGGATVPEDKGSNPYQLAQIANALARAGLPSAEEYIQHLLSLSVDGPTGLYWEMPLSKDNGNSKGVAVETAGYALMAMTASNPDKYKEHAHRIVKWMSSQRNSQGGFHSTQDTIIALQSMAMHESTLLKEPQDLDLSVVGGDVSTTLKITEDNKLLTQRVEVPSVPARVAFDMAGTGCAMVQGVVRYNVKEPEASEAFSLSVMSLAEDEGCGKHDLRVCASYLLPDQASNMAVIEVNLVSGFVPDKQDLKRVVGYGTGNVKRYEVDGLKVMFYINELTADQTCVNFGVKREMVVDEAKPGTVKVYDYYEPEFTISETYDLTDCTVRLLPPPVFDIVEALPMPLPERVVVNLGP